MSTPAAPGVERDPFTTRSRKGDAALYHILFFCSGFAALLYQIVWQRALFTLYGVNIESVTVIVTVFMLGLGIGSLAGGALSQRPNIPLLMTFGVIETAIGLFGAVSLGLFHRIGVLTAGASLFSTGIISFAMLLVPTMLMGSTLPLLGEHFIRYSRNVGESLGTLYAVNTFGSAVACFFAALFIMRTFGQAGAVRCAASINVLVGLLAIGLHFLHRSASSPETRASDLLVTEHKTIPLPVGMFLAGAVGFVSLAYEIIWYRLYSFTYGSSAPCFALLLAFYLCGIAYGSVAVRDGARQKLRNDLDRTLSAGAIIVILGSITAFLVGPALSFWVSHVSLAYGPSFVLVFVSAALLGASFPLVSHAAIDPSSGAGRHVSLLYLSNIIGSVLGSFLIGFVVMDHLSTRATSVLLLAIGLAVSLTFSILSRQKRPGKLFIAGTAVSLVLLFTSGPIFSGLYERLLMKTPLNAEMKDTDLTENRSGVIAVTSDGTVFGGGVYDGRFNTDLINDTNGIFRAFAMASLHPNPHRALVIGLSSGSWTQVLANDPRVEDITVVEINPGYLPLIAKHSNVASLLHNPKVHIVIDDGRRWLLGHPDQRFDFILMNTTFHWRANVSNLLSVEFMQMLRTHLAAGGVAYYNTTFSDRALATGSTIFPYSLRIANFLAVSDSPINFDRSRWREQLTAYRIEGHPVFDLANPLHQERLEEVLQLSVKGFEEGTHGMLESRDDMLARFKGTALITDDNMGDEWR